MRGRFGRALRGLGWRASMVVAGAVVAAALYLAWNGTAAKRPTVAVVSLELAQQPNLMRAAAERRSDRFKIDLFGLGDGHLPGIDGVDLAAYDLVVVEGVGPRLAQYRAHFDEVSRQTRLLVVNGEEWISGNVDAAALPDLAHYWSNATVENYTRLFDYLGSRLLGLQVEVEPPVVYPERAFYHPEREQPFEALDDYLAWAQARLPGPMRPRIGLVFYRSLVLGENAGVIDALIGAIERQGGLPVPLWRSDSRDSLHWLQRDAAPAVDALILCASQIDYRNHAAGIEQARRLGVAVLNCTTDYSRTPEQWARDLGGFSPDRSGQLALSEASGIIEPMMVGARTVDGAGRVLHAPMSEQVEWRVARALAWAALHRTPNAEKRLLMPYFSEGGGKANVGSDPDSYLDAQASLAALLRRLRDAGYDVGDDPLPDRAALAKRMAEEGSNITAGVRPADESSRAGWADAVTARQAREEIERRIAQGSVVLIAEDQYLAWYRELPANLREQTEARWGPAPGHIMVHTDAAGERSLVIPALRFGKVVLAAHPTWGYLQDEAALDSTEALPPHHQYIAFYLWMQHSLRAHAFLPLFTQLSLMPGKQQGPAYSDWVGRLIGNVPHIQPTPLQANGGVGNKRRTHALTVGFMPPLARNELPPDLAALRKALQELPADSASAQRQRIREQAVPLARELGLDPTAAEWPVLEAALRDYLLEVSSAAAPVGGHVLGQPPDRRTTVRMLHAMLAGDGSAAPSQEQIEAVLEGRSAAVAPDTAERIADYARRIAAAPREIDALLEALAGRYIEPGPMQDAVRNPDALPPGRNPYTLQSRRLPTRAAWETGVKLADELIAAHRREHGSAPRKVAFVLWSGESAQHQGAIEAQIFRLLGVRPVWNPRGEVIDVALDDRAALGRPRVDVLVTTSGTYRDHFRDKIDLIAKAVRIASEADETDNAVRQGTLAAEQALRAQGVAQAEARVRAARRVFSTAPGAYSPSTQFALKAGWDDQRLADLYANRLSHAYGGEDEGVADGAAFASQLQDVDAAVFSRSSNAYGLLDTPMPAAYLGGIGMAVRRSTGRSVANYVAKLHDPRPEHAGIETLARAYRKELHSRYFNPEWIQAMQASGYNGARYMAELPEHLLLWDVTTPDLVEDADWEEIKAVYVDDRFGLGLEDYFTQHNPFAREQLLHGLIEAVDRGSWQAAAAVRRQLEQALAETVAKHGASCAPPGCLDPSQRGAPAWLTQAGSTAPGGPQAAPSAAASDSAATNASSAHVEGFALEERRADSSRTVAAIEPRSIVSSRMLLLMAGALALFGAGLLIRPRW